MVRIAIVAGTRPEAIKLAPVVTACQNEPWAEPVLCSSGQHEQILEQAFADFNLIPQVSLKTMSPGQSLDELTIRLLEGLGPAMDRICPDVVLVQGDTATAMAASLVSYYRKIPVGHVEAGLRSNNLFSPFPEEGNRKLISALAEIHFAPTEQAKLNLLAENIPDSRINVTGNTVVDALLSMYNLIHNSDQHLSLDPRQGIPAGKRIVLVTCHRRENFGKPLFEICKAISALTKNIKDIHVIWPVHPNPNVYNMVHRYLSENNAVSLIPPMTYKQMVMILHSCTIVMTDSGGLQEEAPAFKKPILVLRNTTERPEGVEAGCAKVVGTDAKNIFRCAHKLLQPGSQEYKNMSFAINPYGDGHAALKIVSTLKGKFLR